MNHARGGRAAERWAEWMVRWRWAVLLLTLIAVAVLGSGARFLSFTNDYRVFFSKENPSLTAFENLQDTYTRNDNVLIMLLPRSGTVFDRHVLQAVKELTEKAWQVPYSSRVDSLTNFQHTWADGDDLMVEDLVDDPAALSDADLERIRDIAVHEPLLVNRIVAPDGRATGVNITIELPGKDPTREGKEVMAHVHRLVDEMRARYPDIDWYLSGIVVMNEAFPKATQSDMKQLVPLAFLAIVIGLWLFLRTALGTLGVVLVILFSIVMAMGSAGWLGIRLTPPAASAPTLILTLAVADGVHFLLSCLFAMRHGADRHAAVVESLRINFHPIFLTSLTTVIGFLSMNFSDAPPFHDLGNIVAMGVTWAFVLSVSFLPAWAAVMPIRPRARKERNHLWIDGLADFVIRRRRPLLVGGLVLSLGLSAFVPKNQLNDVFVHYFDETMTFRQHADMVDKYLAGLYFIDFSLDSGEPGGVADPEFLRQVDAFAEWLRRQPGVRHVASITDVFKRLNRNMHGDDPAWYRLPEQRDLAAQYLLLYEMSLPYGLDLNNQINVDKSATRLSATLDILSTNEVLALERRAEAWLKQHAPKLATRGASPTIMFANIGKRNIRSMLLGTTVALVLISLVLVFALRSLKLGLISLLPNLLPAGMAFGIWGLLVGEVGLALSVVTSMSLGIVVDDTVHFLSKYVRARREQHLAPAEAVRYAFHNVGVALFVTTVVLTAGFLVLATSHFELNSTMGLMTALTIVLALVLDFFLLPPLLLATDKGETI